MTLLQIKAINKLIAREKPGWILSTGERITMSPEKGKRMLHLMSPKTRETTTIIVNFETLSICDFMSIGE